MSYFSELLSFYSRRAGINSPQIAGYCGMDRVTVYRFMKGKTLPKDKETVIKMAEILQLTTEERTALAESYECTRLGPRVYWERQHIRLFMKSFTGTAPMKPMILYDTDDVEDPRREAVVISGIGHTIKRIQKEVLRESSNPQCEINLIMRAGIGAVMDTLLSAGKMNKALKVKHLIPISSKSYSESKESFYNNSQYPYSAEFSADGGAPGPDFPLQSMNLLEKVKNGKSTDTIAEEQFSDYGKTGSHDLLQNVFKVVRMCTEGFDYEPSYYYTRQEETGQFPSYSNLLITEKAVILFTDDLSESILLSAPDQVTSFREKYHRLADDKLTLFYVYRDIESLMDNMNRVIINRNRRIDESEYYYTSLPCVIPFLTKEMIEKHLRPEVLSSMQGIREDALSNIYDYVDAIRKRYESSDFNQINIYSEAGVHSFMKTGRFAEVPPELYFPLAEEERRQLLLATAEHPHFKFRFVKNELSDPKGMLSIDVMDNAVFITFLIPGKSLCFLYINEPGILLAFRNFFKDFPKEELYSEEESREILRKLAQE